MVKLIRKRKKPPAKARGPWLKKEDWKSILLSLISSAIWWLITKLLKID